MEEMLIENCANGPFYMTPNHQIIIFFFPVPPHVLLNFVVCPLAVA
jgi:hypothetical protein